MNARPQIALPVSGEVLAELEAVSFGYAEKRVLDNVSLTFRAGEMVGVIGPNGAGKTTLLRLLIGLLMPQKGSIALRGRPLVSYPRRELAKMLSLVPQDTQIGYAFTVKEIVAMGRNPYLGRFQPPTAQDDSIIAAAMRETGVLEFADRLIHTLSGGERQRVLIARTIAQGTSIVLLDEATANLDLCHQLEVMQIARAMAERGSLVIAAIHDLGMASRYCNRLVLLAGGGVRGDGAPEEVLTEHSLRHHFSLLASVRPNGDLAQGLSITPLSAI